MISNSKKSNTWKSILTRLSPDVGNGYALTRATLIVARAHILSRPRVMCSQVRML